MPPNTHTAASEAAASAHDTLVAINEACRSRGGHYAQYSCKVVSWDDVSRGTVGGSLSCWGANITDTYLKSKDGTRLFTVRPDNWNEKLGKVSASDVALVAGHTAPGGSLAPVTLRDFLKGIGTHGAYAGLAAGADLADAALDAEVSIRFQTTFLPIDGGDARATLEFATEAYNYNTTDDSDPRNLVLLCTTQGVAVQQDGAGAKRLFHHAVDESGVIHRYWLEAERTDHKVGGAQLESSAERADALRRGKATSSVIGTRAMGTRFNVLMTVQVPLQQIKRAPRGMCYAPCSPEAFGAQGLSGGCCDESFACCDESDEEDCDDDCSQLEWECLSVDADEAKNLMMQDKSRRAASSRRSGVSNAARVSRGTEHDTWPGLAVSAPTRNPHEHVTVTVVLYNTVAGGVPTADDVAAAIDDLEQLYAACGASGKLAEPAFDFIKSELTVQDAHKIGAKMAAQPYAPPPGPVASFDVFPC